ncbi:radical sam protein [Leptolyngbya sp. Heron Island J]|uniref:radical SAM/SPASM domain-containing protein n=1 Tax=Leptolyngbya sp. Heron Island J TaxID=1385935 RepID=UPI0003B958DB|nr:radical SAM protein [Leptolyngbya sp. Heron Island J]ESA34861.1 radical sam protein [Leptolyngbya sp. Heron Island J]
MTLKDPQKLLPSAIEDKWRIEEMILDIPPHGIPVHKKSLEKFYDTSQKNKNSIILQPSLAITSELGLPKYPTIAYLYPQEYIAKNLSSLSTTPTVIDLLDLDEKLHYFADHYGIAIKPQYVRAIVGNTCNLKCVMCPYHSPLIKPNHTTDFFQGNRAMSWEMMTKLAAECGQAGIAIMVGSLEEPLLHPKIVDFIQLCRQQGVPSIHMTTNGQLLDEEKAIALLAAGLTSIDISIDAFEVDTYKRIRGSNLHRVRANVLNFIQLRDRLGVPCNVRTSFVRNQGNSNDEEQAFQDYWLEKVDGVFMLNLAQYQETNMRLNQENQAVQDSIQYYRQKSQGRWPCMYPFTEVAVLPDGRIYYCIETLFRLGFDQEIESLGDYNKQTLQEIWSGDLFRALRRDLILNQLDNRPACKQCDMWMSQVKFQSVKEGIHRTTTNVTEIYQKI